MQTDDFGVLLRHFSVKYYLKLNVIREKYEKYYFKKVTVIDDVRYFIALKDSDIDAECFAAGVKLLGSRRVVVDHERKDILRAVAFLITVRKRRGEKADVKAWVALLRLLYCFTNTRDGSREMSAESLETELYSTVGE